MIKFLGFIIMLISVLLLPIVNILAIFLLSQDVFAAFMYLFLMHIAIFNNTSIGLKLFLNEA